MRETADIICEEIRMYGSGVHAIVKETAATTKREEQLAKKRLTVWKNILKKLECTLAWKKSRKY